MNKINTFIIGAQKAGTTSLYDWMGQHPDISAPEEIKDYHFVTHEVKFSKGWNSLVLFYEPQKVVKIHAAVNYLYFNKTAAHRINKYNPNAKIIVCLRNPVIRAISAYKYFVRTARENCSFKEALNRELKGRVLDEKLSDHTYLEHGKYIKQIEGFLEYFDRKQLHFLIFEELIDEGKRDSLMVKLFQFLDIDPEFEVSYTHRNKSGKPKSALLNRLIRKNYSLKTFKNLIPFSIRKKIGIKLKEINISDEDVKVNITDKQSEFLNGYFKKTINELEIFLEKDLSNVWDY